MAISLLCLSCTAEKEIMHVCTTQAEPWTVNNEVQQAPSGSEVDVTIDTSEAGREQTIEGFGACFNELGWTSLSQLPEADRKSIMKELFEPDFGANFTICRMPIGANDFARDWYSYDEVPGDFEMKHFSIDNDRETLIPFIKEARTFQPHLRLWGSPWCPPSWMKTNKHYAMVYTGDKYDPKYRNGLPKDKEGSEGTDMFVQEDAYLKAYALYFKKYIQAYAEEGIPVFGVMPQNEFNSPTIYPSCCWTAHGLARFIGRYLGPAMEEVGVDVMFGTMERPNMAIVDTLLTHDKESARYIKAAGFQWAGKEAVGEAHRRYPDLPLLQTEQECGNGKNTWDDMVYCWGLMKHYLECGVSVYDYWNISLLEGGISRWGWAQNSLVVVDAEKKTFRYTYEYYLLKHFSHFIRKGAVRLKVDAGAEEMLAFENPDGGIVLLCMEKEGKDKQLSVSLNGRTEKLSLKAGSLNTWLLKK